MMNTLRRGVVMMMAVVVGMLAGCASRTGAGQIKAGTETQVEVSARYVRIPGALPEAKGALAFLADGAGLKAGAVVLTKKEAEAAIKKLVKVTKQEVRSTPRVAVLAGEQAKMMIEAPHLVNGREELPGISTGAGPLKSSPDFTVELSVSPQVAVNGVMRVGLKMEVTTLESFMEYGGVTVTIPAAASGISAEGHTAPVTVTVPKGFYMPVFSTHALKSEVRIAERGVVVLRTDRKAPTMVNQDGSKTESPSVSVDAGETLLVFLSAERVAGKGEGDARGASSRESWLSRRTWRVGR